MTHDTITHITLLAVVVLAGCDDGPPIAARSAELDPCDALVDDECVGDPGDPQTDEPPLERDPLPLHACTVELPNGARTSSEQCPPWLAPPDWMPIAEPTLLDAPVAVGTLTAGLPPIGSYAPYHVGIDEDEPGPSWYAITGEQYLAALRADGDVDIFAVPAGAAGVALADGRALYGLFAATVPKPGDSTVKPDKITVPNLKLGISMADFQPGARSAKKWFVDGGRDEDKPDKAPLPPAQH